MRSGEAMGPISLRTQAISSFRNSPLPRGRAFEDLAVGIDDLRDHAEERSCRGARFESGGSRKRRDQDAAGLGLPPGVHDRAAAIADDAVIPLPGFGIDRLANGPEEA